MNNNEHDIIKKLQSISLNDKRKVTMREKLADYADLKPVRTPIRQEKREHRWHWTRRAMALPLVAIVLLVGFGGSVAASEGALPGSIFYPLKRQVVEPLRTAAINNPEKKAANYVVLAGKRLAEASELAAQGDLDNRTRIELQESFRSNVVDAERVAQAFESQNQTQAALKVRSALEAHLTGHTRVIRRVVATARPTTMMQSKAIQPTAESAVMMADVAMEESAPVATSMMMEIAEEADSDLHHPSVEMASDSFAGVSPRESQLDVSPSVAELRQLQQNVEATLNGVLASRQKTEAEVVEVIPEEPEIVVAIEEETEEVVATIEAAEENIEQTPPRIREQVRDDLQQARDLIEMAREKLNEGDTEAAFTDVQAAERTAIESEVITETIPDVVEHIDPQPEPPTPSPEPQPHRDPNPVIPPPQSDPVPQSESVVDPVPEPAEPNSRDVEGDETPVVETDAPPEGGQVAGVISESNEDTSSVPVDGIGIQGGLKL